MVLPDEGISLSKYVVRFNKLLFGLKQAARQRSGLLVITVTACGMEQSKSDSCVFHVVDDGKIVLRMAVHLDYLIVSGTKKACDHFHSTLTRKTTTNSFRELKWRTGSSFTRDRKIRNLTVTQGTFIDNSSRKLRRDTGLWYSCWPEYGTKPLIAAR